jgi:CheY-like chemotaxis protein
MAWNLRRPSADASPGWEFLRRVKRENKSAPVTGRTGRKPVPVHTVLIIDDEEPIRDAVRFILDEADYAVQEAPDGREGLELLRASKTPLVVLLDLMMPGMSGIELLRTLSAEPEMAARHAYIIFSAARAFSTPTLQFYLPGKRLFDLPKPFNLDELIAIVELAVQQLDGERETGDGLATVDTPAQATDTDGTPSGA